ncbi:hypothetical protein OBBRIDRAFT_794148 [Obba rivulosa]|uniref:Uncharacterized protein n=1 Tax=Obba rivulosa TaxID=1052685 RepID=A0A8E2B1N1_9APHY|nr:hypothetical protein OBBRIDRAFT_794148 [Obba rivulosa]
MTRHLVISDAAACPPEEGQTQACQQWEGPFTSYEPLQSDYVPPIVRPFHMLLTVPENLAWDEHCHLGRSIFDQLRAFGFPDPTPEDVRSYPYLAARIVLAIFRTRIPEYHVRWEFVDIDHLIVLVKKSEILREYLADAVEIETFALMRRLAFWFDEGPPLDR